MGRIQGRCRLSRMSGQIENRTWEGLIFRGVIAILFGAALFARPGAAVTGLVYLFGIYAMIDGIFALVAGGHIAQMRGRWWPMFVTGILGIIVGVIAFAHPGVTAVGLVAYVSVWAILTGLGEVVAAYRLRRIMPGEWRLGFAGLLSVAFGILIATRPAAGLASIVFLIAGYAVFFGALEIWLGFGLRSAEQRLGTRTTVR
jgi:uncharacterized membrane protein HdeD (DUF308 family)